MAIRLDSGEPTFEAQFRALLAAKREASTDVEASARAIVEDVRRRGDAALLAYTEKFDRLTLTADRLRVAVAEIEPVEIGRPSHYGRCRHGPETRYDSN